MKDIYVNIAAQLRKVQGMELGVIDIFNQQYNDSKTGDMNEPITCNAVYMEIFPAQWQPSGNGVQTSIITVRLHVVHQSYAETKNADLESNFMQDDAYAYLDFAKAVHAKIQGYSFDKATPFERVTSTEDINHDSQRITLLDYAFMYEDDSANIEASWPPATAAGLKVHRDPTIHTKQYWP